MRTNAEGTLSVKDSGGEEQFEPSFWSGSGFIEEYISRLIKNIVFFFSHSGDGERLKIKMGKTLNFAFRLPLD